MTSSYKLLGDILGAATRRRLSWTQTLVLRTTPRRISFIWVSAGLSATAASLTCFSSLSFSIFKLRAEHSGDIQSSHGNQSISQSESPDVTLTEYSNDNADDSVTKPKEPPTEFLGNSFLKFSWNGLSDIQNTLSSWTWPINLNVIQDKISALLLELNRGPGSLFSQIIDVSPDPVIYPECEWDAEVRLGDALCVSERVFLKQRRRRMISTFARLFEVPEDELDIRDLPIVALAGSGGGYRATINTIGSLIGAHQSGIWDCTTYVTGISGSCWALGALYTGVAGSLNPQVVANHLKERMNISYFDTSTLDLLTTSPTNKYLLWGILRKANTPSGTISLTDIYGTLVSTRLFVPADLSLLDPRCLSLHHMRRYIDNASLPLPIFTAVHHDIPGDLAEPVKELKEQKNSLINSQSYNDLLINEEQEIAHQTRWLWFEFTPYEVGCDELGAWIPSWALGRRFERGKNLERLPELNFTILSGIYASAFCATLKDYFKEVQPMLRTLPTQLFDWLQEIITNNDKELHTIHAVVPDEIPNFVKGMAGNLRETSPPDIENRDMFGFMDAGVDLNIPYYPLLRRDVDCIIALDASTDSQNLWFTRAEEYAAKRGLSKWPRGARWPAFINSGESGLHSQAVTAPNNSPSDRVAENANRSLAEAQEKELTGQATRQIKSQAQTSSSGIESNQSKNTNLDDLTSSDMSARLSSCTIWIGSSTEGGGSAKLDELEELDLRSRDGIAIVYIPLLSNPVVSDFDPLEISTWRSQMDEDVTERLLKVSQANFEDGRNKIIRLLKAIWLRKRTERERIEFDA